MSDSHDDGLPARLTRGKTFEAALMVEQSVRIPSQRTGHLMRASILVAALVVVLGTLALVGLARFLNDSTPARSNVAQPRFGNLLFSPPQHVRSMSGLDGPMGVAVADDGTLFAVESGGQRLIRHLDSEGNLLGAFAPPGTSAGTRSPIYVSVNPKGNVYVTDRSARTIYVFSNRGQFVGHLSSPFADEDWQPVGVSFDRDGNIYVTDVTPGKHRILVLDPGGKLKLAFGSQGSEAGEFSFPNAVAIDRDGRMYVSDGNNGRVQMFDPGGKFLGAVGRGAAQGDLAFPRGLAIDNTAHLLFVVDTLRHDVQYYDIGGDTPRFVNAFGDSGSADSDLSFPTGISVDGKGHVFVSDREHNRVIEWRY